VSTAVSSRIRPLGRGTPFGGVLATLLIHLSLAGLIYFAHVKSPPPIEQPRDVIVTKLVAFGKPREKFWLPRIVQPPKPKTTALKLTDDPDAAPAPKEAPKLDDADLSKSMKHALKRAQLLAQATEEPAEGSLTGSTEGTASQGSVGDEYATAVYTAIQRNWVTPTGLVTDAELAKLVMVMRISITPEGKLGAPVVKQSSGNEYFDDSCIQAVKATAQVPPPPPNFRRGFNLRFAGKELAR
jgi:TonB family protein